MKCPKCGGEMEEGIFGDRYYAFATAQLQWGKTIKRKLITIGVPVLENSKDIITYRCKSCGYLESYAK